VIVQFFVISSPGFIKSDAGVKLILDVSPIWYLLGIGGFLSNNGVKVNG